MTSHMHTSISVYFIRYFCNLFVACTLTTAINIQPVVCLPRPMQQLLKSSDSNTIANIGFIVDYGVGQVPVLDALGFDPVVNMHGCVAIHCGGFV